MFTITYRCVYRDFWYEGPTTDDWNYAVQLAQQIKAQRRTAVMIQNNWSGEVYQV